MAELQDFKVVIRGPDGKYISGSTRDWGFAEERCRAIVFDYRAHRVEEQLDMIRQVYGLALEAVPLDPEEIYETCDRCKQLATPFRVYFDGRLFLCQACREAAAAA